MAAQRYRRHKFLQQRFGLFRLHPRI
jgi:hypothetical protein